MCSSLEHLSFDMDVLGEGKRLIHQFKPLSLLTVKPQPRSNWCIHHRAVADVSHSLCHDNHTRYLL